MHCFNIMSTTSVKSTAKLQNLLLFCSWTLDLSLTMLIFTLAS